jgi:hypothetical protein
MSAVPAVLTCFVYGPQRDRTERRSRRGAQRAGKCFHPFRAGAASRDLDELIVVQMLIAQHESLRVLLDHCRAIFDLRAELDHAADPRLSAVATAPSTDMAARGYFARRPPKATGRRTAWRAFNRP